MAEPAGEQGSRYYAGMEKLRKAFEEAQPNLIIEIANEHFVNFYLNNMPAICVGTGGAHYGPVEPESWLGIKPRMVPGQPQFAQDLVREAYAGGFDVAFSEELALDHGTMVPLHFITPDTRIPVVPIIVNNIAEPMPAPWRLYQLGKLIAQVVENRPKDEKVALIATGGISHWVGTPEMGRINVEFDERFLDHLEHGRGETIAQWTPEEIGRAGNGAHEIRNWITVMGAMARHKAEVASYEAVVPWVTGCGAVIWKP
jgi:hypothetical protein